MEGAPPVLKATAPQVPAIQWKPGPPIWVEQWPLPSTKLQALREIVSEQLNLGHIRPSTSPWNTPIFVIKKSSGKWRMLQDLRSMRE